MNLPFSERRISLEHGRVRAWVGVKWPRALAALLRDGICDDSRLTRTERSRGASLGGPATGRVLDRVGLPEIEVRHHEPSNQ